MDILERGKYLVISGGGPRGIAFIGALSVLKKIHKNYFKKDFLRELKGACGTSIGAVIALAYVCSIDFKKLKNLFLNEKIWNNDILYETMDLKGLYNDTGLCPSKVLYDKIDTFFDLLELPKNIDFLQLYKKTGKTFFCNASGIGNSSIFKMSHTQTPYLSVRKGICMSMSFPCVFKAIKYQDINYVDGGFYANYLPEVFPKDEVIGISVDIHADIQHNSSQSGLPWFKAMINSLCCRNELMRFTSLDKEYKNATLFVYTPGIGPNTFHVDKEMIENMYYFGQLSALWFLLKKEFLTLLIISKIKSYQNLLKLDEEQKKSNSKEIENK